MLAASALTAAPVAAQEESSLVYAIDGEISYLNNANSDVPSAEAVQWLYNGLYTYDDSLTPVPDIAAGLCRDQRGRPDLDRQAQGQRLLPAHR